MALEHKGMTLEDTEQELETARVYEELAIQNLTKEYGGIKQGIAAMLYDNDAIKLVRDYRKTVRIRSEFEEMVKRKTREAAIATQRCD